MSVAEDIARARWSVAEAQLIATAAYGRLIEVEPHHVLLNLATWRAWFYELIPTTAVLKLPGARLVEVSGR